MAYEGSCHCGRVAFRVEGTIDGAVECNCSICHRKGILMWFVPREALVLSTPDANASTYTFHRHVIKHRFCPDCGIHVYGEAPWKDGTTKAAVNLRCLEGVDLASVPVTHYDGRSR